MTHSAVYLGGKVTATGVSGTCSQKAEREREREREREKPLPSQLSPFYFVGDPSMLNHATNIWVVFPSLINQIEICLVDMLRDLSSK